MSQKEGSKTDGLETLAVACDMATGISGCFREMKGRPLSEEVVEMGTRILAFLDQATEEVGKMPDHNENVRQGLKRAEGTKMDLLISELLALRDAGQRDQARLLMDQNGRSFGDRRNAVEAMLFSPISEKRETSTCRRDERTRMGLVIDAGLLVAIIWFLSRDPSVKEAFFKLFLMAAGVAMLGFVMLRNMDPVPALSAYYGMLVLGLHFAVKVSWGGALLASAIFIAVKIAIRMLFNAVV
jgi:hypothetical protein